jgi:hypothetical protein
MTIRLGSSLDSMSDTARAGSPVEDGATGGSYEWWSPFPHREARFSGAWEVL